jgi:hypothetical protein
MSNHGQLRAAGRQQALRRRSILSSMIDDDYLAHRTQSSPQTAMRQLAASGVAGLSGVSAASGHAGVTGLELGSHCLALGFARGFL